MFVLACILLVVYALLAGLTLAICELGMTWLQMRVLRGLLRNAKLFIIFLQYSSIGLIMQQTTTSCGSQVEA